ncbi:TRAP transporter small permease subunit [Marinobacter subterrani]|uniref:TRAP transporter small permease protein n=1 Tax=Marinobacter subterrani TaxID=1658765 RepID=A0A0J7M5T6_9GAMM|nr:TRAP transporter small permease subunit [Marinobacter subterrani]KMQ76320.1 TRAP-type mannitol/chloroaromatic compound transport system, small permease component [Marinobacter subterrani]
MSDLSEFGFVMPHWFYWGWLAIMPLLMMAWDRWATGRGVQAADKNAEANAKLKQIEDELQQKIDYSHEVNWFTMAVDWISEKSGIFISFWTVNAVVFYFFEVIMRYLFNQPTIWVHEASFLLFGMQYLLAGAFALLHGAHVRVDVVYNFLPVRGRIGMDIFTSMFFFMFAFALVITSWTFFQNSYSMDERTVETWGIQYWPVKGMMLLGSVLILLAGMSKLIKDIALFIHLGREQKA